MGLIDNLIKKINKTSLTIRSSNPNETNEQSNNSINQTKEGDDNKKILELSKNAPVNASTQSSIINSNNSQPNITVAVYDKIKNVIRKTTTVASTVASQVASSVANTPTITSYVTTKKSPKSQKVLTSPPATTTVATPTPNKPKSLTPKIIPLVNGNTNNQLGKSNFQQENVSFLVPNGPISNIYDKIFDCCVFVIHCKTHNKVAVSKSPSNAVWLPFTTMVSKFCWNEAALEGLPVILSNESNSKYDALRKNHPYEYIQILEIFRLQMPQTRKFITRATFYVRLKSEKSQSQKKLSKFTCCFDSAKLIWLDLDFICNGIVENIWGPELVEFCRLASQSTSSGSLPQKLFEFGLEQVFHYFPRDSPQNLEESLLKSVKITEKDIERLYNDFLDHCYPSFYMTIDSFRHYMLRNGFETQDIRLKRLFNAFNYNNNGFLTFHEVLLGFVSMERDTPHDEVRIKFIFRYYDAKKKGVLYEEDFKKIIRDMNVDKEGKQLPITDAEITKKAKEALVAFQAKPIAQGGRPGVPYKKFLTGIASHSFRGTSVLCRSRRNIFSHISRRMTARTLKKTMVKGQFGEVLTKKTYSGVCNSCRLKKYRLANYIMLINQYGYYDSLQTMTIPECVLFTEENNKTDVPDKAISPTAKTLIEEARLFRSEHPANVLMKKVREFNNVKYKLKDHVGVMAAPGEREQLYLMMKSLYDELEPILKSEKRCKPVYSPCFVIGDIHGNIEDLMSLEKTIWKRFPCTAGVHYLFLGDYVDRGRWSVECAIYLLSMKVLTPKSVTLLRGNHEVRDIQIKYTYKRECMMKYDEVYGQRIWDLTNKIFDRLPLCATVDDVIFCAHGGIPHSVAKIEEINATVPTDIFSPEQECVISWEIMWSDPITTEQFRDIIESYNVADLRERGIREGFINNSKRGTAYYFNEVAANNFFEDNSLTHIIRAHEVPKWGFMFHFDFKCTTIFSCSHYCGNDNDCACILVDREILRVIRVDTTNNLSATDPF